MERGEGKADSLRAAAGARGLRHVVVGALVALTCAVAPGGGAVAPRTMSGPTDLSSLKGFQVVEGGLQALGKPELRRIDDQEQGHALVSWPNVRKVSYAVLAALALLGLLFSWNRTLTRQVRARTLALQQSESQLRAGEDRLRSVLDGVRSFVAVLSAEGVLLDCNSALLAAIGRPKEDLVGRPFVDGEWLTRSPATRARLRALIRQAAAGAAAREDLQVCLANGRILEFVTSLSPLRDAGGAVSQVVVSGVDVSERKRAEARHARQRNQLIALTGQRSLPDGDTAAALRLITEGAARTLAVERVSIWRYRAERSAITCVDLFEARRQQHSSGAVLSAASHPTYFRALAEVEVVAADDAVSDPRTAEFADGYLGPLGISSMLDVPIHVGGELDGVLCHEHVGPPRTWTDDEKTFAVAIANLVSLGLEAGERSRAEAAQRASEERLRRLAENIQEVFWMTDPANREVLYVSPAYERIWGRTCASVYQAPQTWLDAVHPEDRARVAQAAARQAQGGYDETYRILRPDGSERWVHDRAFPVLGPDGAVVQVVGAAQDVSDLKHAEEERRALEAQLRHSQKMDAIGRLAGGVAHDFNNMLGVILGQADMALGHLAPGDPLCRRVQAIRDAANRSAALTRQLLAFSRQQTIAPRVLDLNEQIAGMERLLRRLIGEDIALEVRGDPALWPVSLDPSQVDQIVANLAVNARDAMPDGGALTFETGNLEVPDARARLLGVHAGEYVMLAVSDNGCGMDERTRERAFEPFFTTKPEGRGTGLGLATIYGIVKQNEGFVDVQSEVGQGTRISLYFPRTTAAREAEPLPVPPPRLGPGHDTILLVEDQEELREVARTLLEELGYSVVVAANGGDAVALCQEHPAEIHLLLTDVVMPGMNGRELAQRIQAIKPGIRILFTSGYTADIIGRRGVLDPGVQFIEKPFTLESLARKVHTVLEGAA
jgi:PAS domain S-box-containing protein